MEGTLAEVRMFAGNFAPRGWQLCNGQLLPIAQWTAVFALIGTIYGGNGQTTFGLPDFRSRIPVGTGLGPGLSDIQIGQVAGTEAVTLLTTNLPAHNHTLTNNLYSGSKAERPGGNDSPVTKYPSILSSGNAYSSTSDVNMATLTGSVTLGNTGGNQPFDIHSPYLGINIIMCVEGIFPSRD